MTRFRSIMDHAGAGPLEREHGRAGTFHDGGAPGGGGVVDVAVTVVPTAAPLDGEEAANRRVRTRRVDLLIRKSEITGAPRPNTDHLTIPSDLLEPGAAGTSVARIAGIVGDHSAGAWWHVFLLKGVA